MGRICSKCGSDGPFKRNGDSPDGLHSVCKNCTSKTSRRRREKTESFESEKERAAAYYAANKERLSANRRKRYAENKEKALATNRKWSEANKEHHRALNRQWSKKNPEAARALVARRRARIAGVGGSYTKADIRRMHDEQSGKCPCGALFSEVGYHVDHVHPLSLGGTNDPSNLQLLCPTCNRRKGAKTDYAVQVHR